ncbi:MAG: hypothetical protein PHP53_22235 [Prolixibacteraceae bacterium]|nr:hypothetical protein [Prolixibacteraceae bacterium]
MNYYFIDVSAYTALKNNAENEAVGLIQKFHRFVISDEDLKPLVEFLTQQTDRINKKHKRCSNIRFCFKEGYSEGNWIFEFCDSYKISFRLISKGMERITNGQCLSKPEWAASQLTLF